MKRIIFNEFKINSFKTVIVFLFLILYLVVTIRMILEIGNPKVNGFLCVIVNIINMSFLLRSFWFKNYIEWNKTSITLKLNKSWFKTIIFDSISEIHLDNETQILKIIDNRGFEKIFNTTGIQNQDIDKLLAILYRNANLQTI